jgi:ribosomal protein S19
MYFQALLQKAVPTVAHISYQLSSISYQGGSYQPSAIREAAIGHQLPERQLSAIIYIGGNYHPSATREAAIGHQLSRRQQSAISY